jgi:hypothetical protein
MSSLPSDLIVRILSPEMAAEKLGWTLADVHKRREELGLGEFKPRRWRRKEPLQPRDLVKPTARRKPVKKSARRARAKSKAKAAR